MSGKPRYTVEQVGDALRRAGGLKAVAARILECDRDTVHRYCQRHPALQRVADEQVETMLDVAEGNIRRQVQAGDVETSKWLLRTRGRSRGYGDRQEVEHSARITLADIAKAAAGFDES